MIDYDNKEAKMNLAESQREAKHSADALGGVLLAITALLFFAASIMIISAFGGGN